MLIWLVILCMFLVGEEVRDSLFPSAVFTIGQGKSRFRDKERIQWGVGITFLVSLAAGLVIWLITR
jgi:hypothetical protein